MAAPVHRPVKPRSVIGVSRRRSGPKRSNRPTVVAKLPPRTPMPSPTTNTIGSRSISSARPSRAASVKVSSRIHVLQDGRRFWVRTVFGPFERVGRHLLDLAIDRVQGCGVGDQVFPQALERIALAPLLNLLASAIATVAHALGVRPRAIGGAGQQGRTLACSGTSHGCAGGGV